VYLTILAFATVLTAATIRSVDPMVSTWGSYERHQGLFTIVAYCLFFFLVGRALETHGSLEGLLDAAIFGSVAPVLYGLLQACGLDPVPWVVDPRGGVFATLGNPVFLGAYLAMIVPLTTSRLVLSVGAGRFALTILIATQLLAAGLAGSKGGLLGIMAGGITLALLLPRVARGDARPGRPTMGMTITAVAVVVPVLAFLVGWASATRVGLRSWAQFLDHSSLSARLLIWKGTLALIASAPVLGKGPDTMGLVFHHFAPASLSSSHLVDRAHNLLLDIGAAAGIAGAAVLVVLFLCTFLRLRRLYRSAPPAQSIILAAIISSLCAYIVVNQFNFDCVTTATLFWFLVGVAASPTWEGGRMKPGAAISSQLSMGPANRRAVTVGRLPAHQERLFAWQGWRRMVVSLVALLTVAVVATSMAPAVLDLSFSLMQASGDFCARWNSSHDLGIIALSPYFDIYESQVAIACPQTSSGVELICGLSRRKCLPFDADRDGNSEIYIMNADGRNQTHYSRMAWMLMPLLASAGRGGEAM